MIDLTGVPRDALQAMAEAAAEVRTCQRVLAKTGDTVVGELLRGQGTVYEWRHYPPGDVYDAEYHAQYYYHCHPEGERPGGEHGHFHTFLRPLGMPDGVRPAPLSDQLPHQGAGAGDNDALSHLIGIGMDQAGRAVRLFTTNRWVTGETWYAAADVVRMLDGFVVDHARPSWPLNRWITALMRLYRPLVVQLLQQRDATIAQWQQDHPGTNAYEDRALEVTSEAHVSVEEHVSRVELAMRRLRRRQREKRGVA